MWGGVKKRIHHGDVFKRWSASQGLDALRSSLYKEPRPWYIAYTLHQANHQLQDHHCARLLAWSASIVELRPSLAGKEEAYRYTQEMFNIFVRHHKIGQQTFHEYMRVCAVGKDLSSAFEWFKYWQEAHLSAHDALGTLSWLLQVAALSPNDERVEDMALLVMQLYKQRFATPDQEDATSSAASSATQHPSPLPPAEETELQRFGHLFAQLGPRVAANPALREFVASLPSAASCTGWPTESVHRLFPQLEQRVGSAAGGQRRGMPRLRDSILHPSVVTRLEDGAARHDVAGVMTLVEAYEDRVRQERERSSRSNGSGSSSHGTPAVRHHASGEAELWGMYADPTATAFRRKLLEAGGLTPEMYHYLITALAATQPSAALRTLRRMEESQLRPLDLTRAAVLVAVRDSADECRRLFQQQLDEIQLRARVDAEHGTVKAVEAYWKYDYVDFFHHRNALDRREFYELLLHQLGPKMLQQLLLDTQTHGVAVAAEDLVHLDDDLRAAACRYFRSQVGRNAVQRALDDIATHMPQLDVGLVGTLPHFGDYYMDANDGDAIANTEAALQALIQPYETIYVLDTSFVETSESFLSVGASSSSSTSSSSSLVLVPYLTLSQLAASVENADRLVTFDPALQQMARTEPFLASQRLRGLFAMVTAPGPKTATAGRRTRVLHFTECLCAHQLDAQAQDALGLRPTVDDNDQLLLVLAMLSSLKAPSTRLILCTDDVQLVQRLGHMQSTSLFGSAVEVISTAPPENLSVEEDLVDDNPVLGGSTAWCAMADFEPRLSIAADAPPPVETNPSATAEADVHAGPTAAVETVEAAQESAGPSVAVVESPWLALLEESDESVQTAHDDSPSPLQRETDALTDAAAAQAATDLSSAAQARRERLMHLYATPFDVVPVGAQMEAASAVGSVFTEFHSMEPDRRDALAAERAAARSSLSPEDGGRGSGAQRSRRRRSVLEREMLNNRGASNKERLRMARRLSNASGGRVPFNLRYRVVEANVQDPRNAHLRSAFEAGLARKRAAFRQKHR
ncbi:hypothetical protein NESM_000562800 [Novymonas esmeraldas]|uniref:Uncharacterized protein n=1 Tax=Novymonas esmeraldas TaxID=1808958 RepID=A0AAW0EQ18_9TRYP